MLLLENSCVPAEKALNGHGLHRNVFIHLSKRMHVPKTFPIAVYSEGTHPFSIIAEFDVFVLSLKYTSMNLSSES